MAIQFVGGKTDKKLGAASGDSTVGLASGLTGGIAAAVSAGDLVIGAFATGSTADRTLAITDGTNPYTLIGSELYADDLFDTNLRVAYKFMGGTPDVSLTFGPTGNAADAGAMAVYVFRGVDTGTPLDGVAVATATGIDSVLANPPSITPSTAGAFVVCAAGGGHNAGNNLVFSSSDLTDMTSAGQSDTNDVTIGIAHLDTWSSGAFDAAVFSFSGVDSTDYSWAALSFVLRPAAAATKIPLFMHHYKLMAGT